MPNEPVPAAEWVLERITKNLQVCKMYPVILAGLKHQTHLSILSSFEVPQVPLFRNKQLS